MNMAYEIRGNLINLRKKIMKSALTSLFTVFTISICCSQTILKVGPSQTYPTIQSAYNAIPTTISTPYIIELESGYNSLSETFPITFNSRVGSSSTNTITLRPNVSGLVLASAVANANIIFSGATNVIIDGRVNGTGSPDLTVINSNTNGNCFKIENSSVSCNIKYCKITGVNTNFEGLIYFKALLSKINQNNKVEYNELSAFGTNNCFTFIGTYAEKGINNGATNNTTIYGNSIFNFFKSSSTYTNNNLRSSSIFLQDGVGNGWTIRANHFFEEDSVKISPSSNKFSAYILSTGNQNTVVDSNYFGGSAPFCGGKTMFAQKINASNLFFDFNFINIQDCGGLSAVRRNTFRKIYSDVLRGTLISVKGALGSTAVPVEYNQLGSTTLTDTTYFNGNISFIESQYLVNGNKINNITLRNNNAYGLIISTNKATNNFIGSSANGDSVVVSGTVSIFKGKPYSSDLQEFSNNKVEQIHAPASILFSNAYNASNNIINNVDVNFLFKLIDSNYSSIPVFRYVNNVTKNSKASVSFYLEGNPVDSMIISGNKTINQQQLTGQLIYLKTFSRTNLVVTKSTYITNNIFDQIEVVWNGTDMIDVENFYTIHFRVEGNLVSNIRTNINSSIFSFITFHSKPSLTINNGSFIIRGNTAENIFAQRSIGNYGIHSNPHYLNGSIIIEDNRLAGIRDSAGFLPTNFIGINIWDDLVSGSHFISRNSIENITMNTSKSNSSIVGIYNTNDINNDTIYCTNNKISNLIYASSDTSKVEVTGIHLRFANKASITQNFIGYLQNNSNNIKSITKGIDFEQDYNTLYSNNIIHLGTDTMGNVLTLKNNHFGFYSSRAIRTVDFIHNTVYLKGSAATASIISACLSNDTFTAAPFNLKVYNNLFWNSISFNSSTTAHRTFILPSLLNTSMDFNVYWKDGTNGLSSFNGGATNQNTLVDIKNALIGQNISSVSASPALVNPFGGASSLNLAPTGAPLTGTGFYFSNVSKDYYGINRNNPPSIGAIELSGYQAPTVIINSTGCLPNSTSNSITIQQSTPLQWTNYVVKNALGTTIASGNFSNSATTISNLSTGNYTIVYTNTVTNKNTTATVFIPLSTAPILNVNSSTTPACGSGSGTAQIIASGGTSPYLYSGIGATNTNGNYSNLAPGSYSVNVVSSEGCTGTANITIVGSPVITVTIDSTAAKTLCTQNNGYIKISAIGGTPVLNFSIPGSQNNTGIFSNLAPGNYNISTTDALGCSVVTPVNIQNQTPVLSISGTTTANTKCANFVGAAQIQISGGSSPYAFQWSNGSTSQNISNVNGGNYFVTVTDNGGCSASKQVSVANNIATVSLTLNSVSPYTNCALPNGSATVNANGGGLPYTYSWSNGASGSSISNLPAGNLTVTVTDANECSSSLGVTVTDNRPTITPSVSKTNETASGANDGTAIVTTTGGQTPYTYQWSNGSLTGDAVSNLSPNSYSVTVTDANGCSGTTSFNILAGPNSINTVLNQEIIIYPNPAAHEIKIISGTQKIEGISIYNADGKLVKEITLPENKTIDVSNMAVGVYTIEIKLKDAVVRARWVKI